MMSKVISLKKYQPQSTDRFFFDANVWLYIFCPIGNYKQSLVASYTSFFQNIIKTRATILTSSLILSEVINRWLKLEFPQGVKKNRDTKKYAQIIQTIEYNINGKILKNSQRIEDHFSKINIDEVLLKLKKADFNDSYYSQLSFLENFKIVTNDRDFKAFPSLYILTAK